MSNSDELSDVQEILAEVDEAIAELQTLTATQETNQQIFVAEGKDYVAGTDNSGTQDAGYERL